MTKKCVVIANLASFLLLAIKFYRRAMQLVPDIEFKITYTRSPDGDGAGNSQCVYDLIDSDMQIVKSKRLCSVGSFRDKMILILLYGL